MQCIFQVPFYFIKHFYAQIASVYISTRKNNKIEPTAWLDIKISMSYTEKNM